MKGYTLTIMADHTLTVQKYTQIATMHCTARSAGTACTVNDRTEHACTAPPPGPLSSSQSVYHLTDSLTD